MKKRVRGTKWTTLDRVMMSLIGITILVGVVFYKAQPDSSSYTDYLKIGDVERAFGGVPGKSTIHHRYLVEAKKIDNEVKITSFSLLSREDYHSDYFSTEWSYSGEKLNNCPKMITLAETILQRARLNKASTKSEPKPKPNPCESLNS